MNMRLYHESLPMMPQRVALAVAVLCIGLSVFMFYLFMKDNVDPGSPVGAVIISSIAITLAITFLLIGIRIKITVTNETLRVGIFKGRLVMIKDIERISQEEFSPLRDFLGWGLRYGRGGWAYVAADTNKGLRIHLKDDKSFLISTKRIFEFESAMRIALKAAEQRSRPAQQ
jgi:hypothetical protein